MKKFLATGVSSIVGLLVGVAVWTVLVCFLLFVYWIGYVVLFLGVVCGRPGGKGFGLGLLDAPEHTPEPEQVLLLTAIAFTWGEILAALLGALLGAATAVGGMKFLSFMKRIAGRRSDASINAPSDVAPKPGNLQ